mgnify:CR=1 FL=1
MQSVAFRAHPLGRPVTEVKLVAVLDSILDLCMQWLQGEEEVGDWYHTHGRVGGEGRVFRGATLTRRHPQASATCRFASFRCDQSGADIFLLVCWHLSLIHI